MFKVFHVFGLLCLQTILVVTMSKSYVEYGISISDDQKLTCNVWAHILNTPLKGYLLTIDVDKPEKSEDKIDVILKALNGSNDFYAVLHHYLAWADENLLRKENR